MQEIIDKIDGLAYDINMDEMRIETIKTRIAEYKKEIKKLTKLKEQVESVLYPKEVLE